MMKTELASSTSLRTVTLDTPLARGEGDPITQVTVRKPNSGELRGLTLMALSQLDYDTMEKLLPRITIPILHKADVARLDPADLMQLGSEVMDFLLPNAAKAQVSPAT
jgi:hypothetical protein